MYSALGNKDAQDHIRQITPKERHCKFLKDTANACECLPLESPLAGQICPNNPYHKPRFIQIKEILDPLASLLDDAIYLRGRIVLSCLGSVEDLSHDEYAAALIIKGDMEEIRHEEIPEGNVAPLPSLENPRGNN